MGVGQRVLGKLKPPWLSWLGLCAITLQLYCAGLCIYAGVGSYLGYLQPLHNAPKLSGMECLGVIAFGLLAIVAAVGIHRNRWWAFLIEFLLFLALIAAMHLIELPEQPSRTRVEVYDLPYRKEIQPWINAIMYVTLGAYLIKQTIDLYRKRHRKQSDMHEET